MTKTITERPMLFSGPLVRAILEGRKTQTRRPVKQMPQEQPVEVVPGRWLACYLDRDWNSERAIDCPFGKSGDQLWVRETFSIVPCSAGVEHYPEGYDPTIAQIRQAKGVSDMGVRYRATWEKCHSLSWKPSIHMPRWASRIDLEVTGVRVERLGRLTKADAIAEGKPADGDTQVRDFADSWDAIYAKQGLGWDDNPWVWVVEFRTVRAER